MYSPAAEVPLRVSQSHAKAIVGEEFVWGIASSAYQTEGAYNVDGKGPSIWDDFSNKHGNIANNHSGNDACQFYFKYKEDLKLLKELGISNFRFSISWPRILPDGKGAVNPKGISFYQGLIDECLENGITPWITLYHWDLPLALEKAGGWANREIVNWFSEYTKLCAKYFGDRVKNWMVLNEPLVFTGAGYFYGVHAPGRKSLNDFLASIHHAVLCQAEGGRVLRSLVTDAKIGTTISCSHVTPKRNNYFDVIASKKADALLNRLFVEPFLGLGYPDDTIKGLRMIDKFKMPGDDERMIFDFDFLGIQSYTREIVKYSMFTPIVRANIVPHEKRNAERITAMNWEVYPEGLYELIMKYSSYAGIKEVIITENGSAFPDKYSRHIISDPYRIQYVSDHINQVIKAKADGGRVGGYFIWTMLDNFEWAEGYNPRFGLIYVDFKTQKRVIKQSALWYSEYLSSL